MSLASRISFTMRSSRGMDIDGWWNNDYLACSKVYDGVIIRARVIDPEISPFSKASTGKSGISSDVKKNFTFRHVAAVSLREGISRANAVCSVGRNTLYQGSMTRGSARRTLAYWQRKKRMCQ